MTLQTNRLGRTLEAENFPELEKNKIQLRLIHKEHKQFKYKKTNNKNSFLYRQQSPKQRPRPLSDLQGDFDVESISRNNKSNEGKPRKVSDKISSLAMRRGLLLTTHLNNPLMWAPSEATRCQKEAARHAGKHIIPVALSMTAFFKTGTARVGGG